MSLAWGARGAGQQNPAPSWVPVVRALTVLSQNLPAQRGRLGSAFDMSRATSARPDLLGRRVRMPKGAAA